MTMIRVTTRTKQLIAEYRELLEQQEIEREGYSSSASLGVGKLIDKALSAHIRAMTQATSAYNPPTWSTDHAEKRDRKRTEGKNRNMEGKRPSSEEQTSQTVIQRTNYTPETRDIDKKLERDIDPYLTKSMQQPSNDLDEE